jgi:hypothetical protein
VLRRVEGLVAGFAEYIQVFDRTVPFTRKNQ